MYWSEIQGLLNKHKLATRLEALGYGELKDNWDDFGRRKDRFVEASTVEENKDLVTLVQELKSEVAELAAGMIRQQAEPERHVWSPDQCNGGPAAVNWPAPPPAPSQWQASPHLPAVTFANTTSWTASVGITTSAITVVRRVTGRLNVHSANGPGFKEQHHKGQVREPI